ncbi:unnamed protein product [Ectocarpus fasciculatus]
MVAIISSYTSSEDDNCGNEEGEEWSESDWLVLAIGWIWGLMGLVTFNLLDEYFSEPAVATFFHRIGILRNDSCWDRCLRSGCFTIFEKSLLGFVSFLVPLPGAIFTCRYICRCCMSLRRQPARRRRQRAVERLRRFPDHRSWRARGWLIMMRARHQRSLARSKSWPVRLRKLERYNEVNIVKYAMRDFMGDQTPPEIELLEAGRTKMNFVRSVMAVVEINEEGLFRHIIKFL